MEIELDYRDSLEEDEVEILIGDSIQIEDEEDERIGGIVGDAVKIEEPKDEGIGGHQELGEVSENVARVVKEEMVEVVNRADGGGEEVDKIEIVPIQQEMVPVIHQEEEEVGQAVGNGVVAAQGEEVPIYDIAGGQDEAVQVNDNDNETVPAQEEVISIVRREEVGQVNAMESIAPPEEFVHIVHAAASEEKIGHVKGNDTVVVQEEAAPIIDQEEAGQIVDNGVVAAQQEFGPIIHAAGRQDGIGQVNDDETVAVQQKLVPGSTCTVVRESAPINRKSNHIDKRRPRTPVSDLLPNPGSISQHAPMTRNLPQITPAPPSVKLATPAVHQAPDLDHDLDMQARTQVSLAKEKLMSYRADPVTGKPRALRRNPHLKWGDSIEYMIEVSHVRHKNSDLNREWTCKQANLEDRRDRIERDIDRLERNIRTEEMDIGFAKSDRVRFDRSGTEEEKAQAKAQAQVESEIAIAGHQAEIDQIRLKIADKKSDLALLIAELNDLPAPKLFEEPVEPPELQELQKLRNSTPAGLPAPCGTQ